MEIRLSYVQARTARAQIEDGALLVRLPRHWPRADHEAALARFRRWAIRRQIEISALPPPVNRPALSELDLWGLVQQVNLQTVRVNVKGVRIGNAKRTRLAQANWQTGVLTFSRYAVDGLADRALRYLILHELTHLRVPDHSADFWALVERHEPEWRRMRKLAQVHFERAVAAKGPMVRPLPLHASEVAHLPFEAVFGQGDPPIIPEDSVPDSKLQQADYDCPDEPQGQGGPAVQMPLFPGLVPEYRID